VKFVIVIKPVCLDVESVSSIDTSLDQNCDSGSDENSYHSESSPEFEDLQSESSNEEGDTEKIDNGNNTDPSESTFIDPIWSRPLQVAMSQYCLLSL
jgi:hypothetical protein